MHDKNGEVRTTVATPHKGGGDNQILRFGKQNWEGAISSETKTTKQRGWGEKKKKKEKKPPKSHVKKTKWGELQTCREGKKKASTIKDLQWGQEVEKKRKVYSRLTSRRNLGVRTKERGDGSKQGGSGVYEGERTAGGQQSMQSQLPGGGAFATKNGKKKKKKLRRPAWRGHSVWTLPKADKQMPGGDQQTVRTKKEKRDRQDPS